MVIHGKWETRRRQFPSELKDWSKRVDSVIYLEIIRGVSSR